MLFNIWRLISSLSIIEQNVKKLPKKPTIHLEYISGIPSLQLFHVPFWFKDIL